MVVRTHAHEFAAEMGVEGPEAGVNHANDIEMLGEGGRGDALCYEGKGNDEE